MDSQIAEESGVAVETVEKCLSSFEEQENAA